MANHFSPFWGTFLLAPLTVSYAFLLLSWNPKTPFCSTLATYPPHPCHATILLHPCHISAAPPLPHFCSNRSTVATMLLFSCHGPSSTFPVTLLQLCSSYNTWPLFTLPLLLPFLGHIVSSDLPLFSWYFNFHHHGRMLRCYKKIKNLLKVLLTA